MKSRCYNPKNRGYDRYGGRGIKVCDRWLNSFDNFMADIGCNRPSIDYSIERVDNNGNYEPCNCRWATMEEQSNNTRRNVKVMKDEIQYTLKQYCSIFKINRRQLFDYRRNLTQEELFEKLKIHIIEPINKPAI